MPNNLDRSRERRWVVLAEDGRFITLGRNSDPTEAEILAAEAGLRSQALAGWLSIMEGNPYVGAPPTLFEVRPLASPKRTFREAAAACLQAIVEKRAALD